MILRQKQKLIFQILILLLMLMVVVRPVTIILIERLKTKRILTSKLERLQTKLTVLEGIDEVLIQDRVQKMETVFPSSKPVIMLMSSLSQLAQEFNLEFGGVSLSPGSLVIEEMTRTSNKRMKDGGLADLQFGFQVGGDFGSITRFMQSLENTAPLMKIEEAALSIKSNPLFTAEATQVVADIRVSAYYQPPPSQLGSLDNPVKLLTRKEEILLKQLINFRSFRQVVPLATVGKENLFEE
jgi:hypothetical protein